MILVFFAIFITTLQKGESVTDKFVIKLEKQCE